MIPYFKILQIDNNATLEEVKEAYHEAARKNHPDLFPLEERQQKHLMMMKINEAYITVIDYITNSKKTPTDDADTPAPPNGPLFQEKKTTSEFEMGNHKDPAYAYYKQGFNHYNKGQTEFHKRFSRDGVGKIKTIFHPTNKQVLQFALTALRHFEKSYSYFMNVVNDYPNSMWADDAETKLRELEKLNNVYTKICDNIT